MRRKNYIHQSLKRTHTVQSIRRLCITVNIKVLFGGDIYYRVAMVSGHIHQCLWYQLSAPVPDNIMMIVGPHQQFISP